MFNLIILKTLISLGFAHLSYEYFRNFKKREAKPFKILATLTYSWMSTIFILLIFINNIYFFSCMNAIMPLCLFSYTVVFHSYGHIPRDLDSWYIKKEENPLKFWGIITTLYLFALISITIYRIDYICLFLKVIELIKLHI